MLQKEKGIVLHALKYNDNSIIVEMYTEQSGRESFWVRMPRSRKSSLRPAFFQPLALIELEADYRHTTQLHRVREAKPVHPFSSIPYDPSKMAVAFYLAEFLYRALREEGANAPLFAYLQHSILWLDECRMGFANFHLVFLMRLSRFIGLYPNLSDYREGDYFDLQNACFTPVRPVQHNDYIQPDEAARLRTLMRMNYDNMRLFGMNRTERNRCLAIIDNYYRLHLPDYPTLKSAEVLKELFDAE